MRFIALSLALGVALALLGSWPVHAQKKDYLTNAEDDKIRDAETPSIRIKLFVTFASQRIEKLKYEFSHPGDNVNRGERINGLINSYAGCVDDATDLIELSAEKQQDIRDGIKEMQTHAPDFLTYLKELDAKGAEVEDFKDNLEDAIEATTDAIHSAGEAGKDLAPPPVRRNPN